MVGVVALRRGGAEMDFLAVPDTWDRGIEFVGYGGRKRVYMLRVATKSKCVATWLEAANV